MYGCTAWRREKPLHHGYHNYYLLWHSQTKPVLPPTQLHHCQNVTTTTSSIHDYQHICSYLTPSSHTQWTPHCHDVCNINQHHNHHHQHHRSPSTIPITVNHHHHHHNLQHHKATTTTTTIFIRLASPTPTIPIITGNHHHQQSPPPTSPTLLSPSSLTITNTSIIKTTHLPPS